jgi:cell wall-associated NlpC family hydrolase
MPPRFRTSTSFSACVLALACLVPAGAFAATGGTPTASDNSTSNAATGGVGPDDPRYKPPHKAKLINGIAYAPKDAPPQVVNAIAAANEIVRMPYRYGGGHKPTFKDSGYDCSGSVSYALHGGGLLRSPLDSSSFMKWGLAGKGRWITVYTNPGHAFMMIAGLRFDTGYRDTRAARHAAPGSGPRWGRYRPTKGFTARHPKGF